MSQKAVPKNIRSYFEKNGIMESYNSLYDAHALEVVGIEGTKKEPDASGKVYELGSEAQATSDSKISVAGLLKLVKGIEALPPCIRYARAVIVLSILVLGLVAVCWPNATEPEPAREITDKVKVDEPVATESAVWENPLPTYTAEDLETLALVIYQEAGGDDCSDETRLMVGTVVLNRVADDRYPDTIAEVATEYKQYGRLYWTGLVWPERASKAEEARAVKRAYDCAERLLDGYRALPSDVIFQAEFAQGTEVVAHQDGFYFCR